MNSRWDIIHGDSLEVMRAIADDSIDALVTDPPAGIEFMGREWDSFRSRPSNPSGPQTDAWHDSGGVSPFARRATPRFTGKEGTRSLEIRDNFTGWMAVVMSECFRVMKPGAIGVVWAIPRTAHWTATALERAGFTIEQTASHTFGSGFPKSHSIPMSIDKSLGHIGHRGKAFTTAGDGAGRGGQDMHGNQPGQLGQHDPISDEAKAWNGYGTALKPAHERWFVVRKPGGEPIVLADPLFCYFPKADRSEREHGLRHRVRKKVNDGRETAIDNPYQRGETQRVNTHPTSKSIDLMRWLVRLSRPGRDGVVVDPFTGSGSTGVGCLREGVRFLGIEREVEYVEISRGRNQQAAEDLGYMDKETAAKRAAEVGRGVQLGLLI